jgi:SAM-dependent methyltransferase
VDLSSPESAVRAVREKYGQIAQEGGSCCGSTGCGTEESVTLQIGYSKKSLQGVPEGANLGLGCGAPVDHLNLQPGETVLDLGSGAGIDVFLSADRVGPTGRVIGVDMTPAMLERARRNAEREGITNVEFREGRLEALPVADASVDAVTSNCVINLVPDKRVVFREIARVLRPGGRLVISDIVLDGDLPEVIRSSVYAYVGCISGASKRNDYFATLNAAGLGGVEILKDYDYLSVLADNAPKELLGLAQRAGVEPLSLRGLVKSLTFRATKPLAR